MDFTTYPRIPGRDVWPAVRAGNLVAGLQSTSTGKLLAHQWQGISENPQANLLTQASNPYLQGSVGGTVFSSSRIHSGECFAEATDSGCALSLLSNQPWGPRNQTSSVMVNNLMNSGVSMAQPTTPASAAVTSITSNAWSIKSNEVDGSSREMLCDFNLGQVSQPINSPLSGELELAQ